MSKTISIDPVTRIEGHSKITIYLDDDGSVDVAHFHVTQYRGFEKFLEGRPFHEMPALTARICGICPVSHLMASAKACDDLMAVTIPPNASRLRTVMNLGQMIQSHALSFFHLSSPDLLLGMDADPNERHILGIAASHPDRARDGIALRKFGQQIIERLSGKRIHPEWVVPGGVSAALTGETRSEILGDLPQCLDMTRKTLDWYRDAFGVFEEEIETFANYPGMFMGMLDENNHVDLYQGTLRLVDADRKVVREGMTAHDFAASIGEKVLPYSYLKTPYYLPEGDEKGTYRVGPLARLNACDGLGTPMANAELESFRALAPDGGAVLSSFHYHYARLIEILFGLENVQQLLQDDDCMDPNVRADAGPNRGVGIGISEAPRGTLMHHYEADGDGLVTKANLIIATGNNNDAMNRGITQAAKKFVHGDSLTEGALNRVEAVIRCFDPCLSCSTHALGHMPLRVELHSPEGTMLDVAVRD